MNSMSQMHMLLDGMNSLHNERKGDRITTETDEQGINAFKNTVAHLAARMSGHEHSLVPHTAL
jgi:hypothetical protein